MTYLRFLGPRIFVGRSFVSHPRNSGLTARMTLFLEHGTLNRTGNVRRQWGENSKKRAFAMSDVWIERTTETCVTLRLSDTLWTVCKCCLSVFFRITCSRSVPSIPASWHSDSATEPWQAPKNPDATLPDKQLVKYYSKRILFNVDRSKNLPKDQGKLFKLITNF